MLFNMGVVVDVVFAVAMISVTTGAVPELQVGMTDIRSAADGTAVIIRCFFRCSFAVAHSVKLNRWLLRSRLCLFAEFSSGVDSPGERDQIYHIFSENQEVVGDSD